MAILELESNTTWYDEMKETGYLPIGEQNILQLPKCHTMLESPK